MIQLIINFGSGRPGAAEGVVIPRNVRVEEQSH